MSMYLVTGGAGFIGSHLVHALLMQGDQVRVLDNFSSGCHENLIGIGGPLEILEGDLRDTRLVAEAVKGIDCIFHEAAFISVPKSLIEPQYCFDENVQGTLNLFEAARKAGVQRIVIASSAAVYGDSLNLPLREDDLPSPRSPYAVSKLINEVYANYYTRIHSLPIVSLRYFNVYGPRQSPISNYAAAIPIFIRHFLNNTPPMIFGDGHQSRDFVFILDVVRANLLAAISSKAAGKVINICSGKDISILDLLDSLSKILPGTPPPSHISPRPGDIYHSLGNPSLAAEIMDFSVQTNLLEGLHQTVEWMQTINRRS